MIQPSLKKNDKKAKQLIITFSIIVFAAVTVLGRYNLAGKVSFSFDVHLFALANAIINGTVALLLVAGDTDGIAGLSDAEKTAAGSIRTLYLIILATHIPLAGLALPFILFAAYRALIGEYDQHKKMVRFIWPVWFYVAVTGVIIYIMIQPFYK